LRTGTLTDVGTISRADLADALVSTLSDATSVRESRMVTSRWGAYVGGRLRPHGLVRLVVAQPARL